jgi:hypothetical protein
MGNWGSKTKMFVGNIGRVGFFSLFYHWKNVADLANNTSIHRSCLLIALALATLEGPSEIASDTFMSRSPLSLSGVGCWVSDFNLKLRVKFSLTHIYIAKKLSSSQCRLIPYLHQRPIFFKANSFICRHFRTYSRCAMFDWSDTVFRRRNVTRTESAEVATSAIEAFNWRDHKRRNPIVFPHFISEHATNLHVIRSSGEEMWRVDGYKIPYYSRGIEGEKRTHPRFADWLL